MKDPITGVYNGAGLIEFMSVERATEALRQLQGMVLDDGKRLTLSYARRKTPRRDDASQRGRSAGYAGDLRENHWSEPHQQNRRGDSRGFTGSREDR